MKIHRFFTTAFTEEAHTITLTDREVLHQITKVLRLTPGETIAVCPGTGEELRVTIASITKNILVGTLTEKSTHNNTSLAPVTLYLAILKRENFELALQKAVEIGINTIVPLVTARTVKTGLNYTRLNKIIKEASEQSGRTTLAELGAITQFRDAVTNASTHGKMVLCDPSGTEKIVPGQCSLFIGPEGGFTSEEIVYAKDGGAHIANLGTTILRGETAAIVASYTATHQ